MTPNYDISAPVLVTGATGYVAGWLVKALLDQGFTVHGTVRNPEDTAKVAHLHALAEAAPGTLKLFKADLLEAKAFDAAIAGCQVVFHTASPFTSKVTDPQRDLVDPALKGTRNVLDSVNRCASVTRVVVTSSCAAIYGDNIDLANLPNQTLTETHWNESSSLHYQAYSYSKTVAERAAWEMQKAQDRWQLVTINPSLVVGPGLAPSQTSESFNLIRQLSDGTMKSGVPDLEIGAVDVRDVAEAHLRAAFLPEASGRHITSARTTSFLEMAQMLAAKYGPDKRLPTRRLPKALLWLIGPMVNKVLSRRMILRNMGHPWRADHSKSVTALGLHYRPLDLAVQEMLQQMRDSGQIKA